MPELVADCPRCGAKDHTFTLQAITPTGMGFHGHKQYEACCLCKNCQKSTLFCVSQKNLTQRDLFMNTKSISSYPQSLNNILDINNYVSLRNKNIEEAPEHTPESIVKVYQEGAESVAGNCPNAAAAMFRLCIDLATKSLLPEESVDGLNSRKRAYLKDRLDWLFDTERLHHGLRGLSDCIKDSGNDGAHDGTVTLPEAEDLRDFCNLLLERLYTEPAKIEIAKERRQARKEAV